MWTICGHVKKIEQEYTEIEGQLDNKIDSIIVNLGCSNSDSKTSYSIGSDNKLDGLGVL